MTLKHVNSFSGLRVQKDVGNIELPRLVKARVWHYFHWSYGSFADSTAVSNNPDTAGFDRHSCLTVAADYLQNARASNVFEFSFLPTFPLSHLIEQGHRVRITRLKRGHHGRRKVGKGSSKAPKYVLEAFRRLGFLHVVNLDVVHNPETGLVSTPRLVVDEAFARTFAVKTRL